MSEVLCSLTTLVGALSMSWQSFKLLKKRETIKIMLDNCEDPNAEEVLELRVDAHGAKREMKEILKFWTVFACLMVFESYFEVFVFWIPFYYTVKFALVLWVMAPHSRGAIVLYESVIAPRLDAQDALFEEHIVPAFQSAVTGAQNALTSGIVGLTISFASPQHLENVESHLETMVEQVRAEKERRLHDTTRADVADPLSEGDADREAKFAQLVEEKAEAAERSGAPRGAKSHSSASSYLPSFLGGSWLFADAVEQAEARASEADGTTPTPIPPSDQGSTGTVAQPRMKRGGGVGWVFDVFGDVVELTVMTKHVLLGQKIERPARADESESKRATVEEEKDSSPQELVELDADSAEEETPTDYGRGATVEERLSAALSKYSRGFETLSDCEDSDSSTPKSLARKSLPKPVNADNAGADEYDSGVEVSLPARRPRREPPPDPLLRRRPATRSRTRESNV